jgi:hypothetical protein
MDGILQSLEDMPLAQTIRESAWMFPTFESLHVVAIALVLGSIMILDLRLLGLASRNAPVSALARAILPWTWGFFAIAAIFGVLMFISNPVEYFHNTAFRIKMIAMVLAGVNMTVFHVAFYPKVTEWDVGAPPAAAKIAGAISLACWLVVLAAGRVIGFTIGNFG